MKYKNCLITVKDIEKSVTFYKKTLGLTVINDFGANKTLTGGVCLQTLETWCDFLQVNEREVIFQNNCSEWYFEEEDFDGFLQNLNGITDIKYVHGLKTHPWGQRVVRFYDPDGHIIEVGEDLKTVVERFASDGMEITEIASRMDIAEKYVAALLK